MTPEELGQLKLMGRQEIVRWYFPRLIRNEITAQQYDWLIRQGIREGPERETEEPIASTTHDDVAKGNTQKERMLAMLSDGEWHSTVDMLKGVYSLNGEKGIARIGARIWDLKDDGHQIEGRRKAGTVWEYRLISK